MPQKSTIEREKRVDEALIAYEEDQFRSIRAIAREYDVAFTTLQNRIAGRPSKTAKIPINKGLTTL
jgi:hypothetical protein